MSEDQLTMNTSDENKSTSYRDLNSVLVTQYLDENSEFLIEYLRKSHVKHRINKLFNENKSCQIFEKLRFQTQLNNLSSDVSSSLKSSLPHITKDADSKQKDQINYEQGELTSASSEPNIPPSIDLPFNSLLNRTHRKEKREKLGKYRKEFKQLSLHEKMFTLVKTLYDSLDLKTTCEKILNTVSLLLDADRCSLFLVIDDENSEDKKCLISLVFDAQSNNSLKQSFSASGENFENDEIRIPYGKGIAGIVAATGQALNIPDAYQDPRFNSSIDSITGYRTKSVLCLPILNENGQCIAVAEAINKSSDNYDDIDMDQRIDDLSEINSYFNKEDEETFAKFMPYISIAIRNSNLYAQSCKEAHTNKVLLELATIAFDETSTTIDNLMSRILVNSLNILQCEKCQVILLNNVSSKSISQNIMNSMIDRIYELNHDESINSTITVMPKKEANTLSQFELDIFNSVFKSGEILNIPSVKNSQKYSNLCETSDSIVTVLCIPVINSVNKVVAFIYASNKIKKSVLNFFTSSDINVAQAFGLFCGIGIQNIKMYEKVVGALNMQQVALDVLSYHVSSTQEEVKVLMKEQVLTPSEYGINDFGFDESTLDDMNTLKGCISIFGDLGFIEKYNIPYDILCRFFLTVKKNYRPVAYHNWRHGFNVMTTMYTIMKVGKYNQIFSDLEIFALLIACICHDLDHRGTSNKFQIKIQSPLAKLYTTSTMEHHHFNQCIIILHNNMNNILMNLSQSQHSTVIEIIEKAILATDLALHFACFDKFLEKAYSTDKPTFETQEDKELLMSMLMTASDLSGATKKWDCHYRLSKQVSSEFFNEGDLEKEKFKNEPSDQMNRNKPEKLPKIQIQFLKSVCIPLYKGLSDVNKNLVAMYDGCNKNIERWQQIIDTN